ncbi:hypothetical protein CPLU01_07194 [Colletotrichum plurivorum]|uniref:Uncharacterized protein n=1 Tax=Colletotrichum plurivorum TaxID=2175906 RepID=A0A8H6KFW9_9PEZI|nr:hypothetical protein CPLU01_07194 [Colletotrichum plurivorum]
MPRRALRRLGGVDTAGDGPGSVARLVPNIGFPPPADGMSLPSRPLCPAASTAAQPPGPSRKYIRRPSGPETFRHQDTASLDSEARPQVSAVPAVDAAAAWHRSLPCRVIERDMFGCGSLGAEHQRVICRRRPRGEVRLTEARSTRDVRCGSHMTDFCRCAYLAGHVSRRGFPARVGCKRIDTTIPRSPSLQGPSINPWRCHRDSRIQSGESVPSSLPLRSSHDRPALGPYLSHDLHTTNRERATAARNGPGQRHGSPGEGRGQLAHLFQPAPPGRSRTGRIRSSTGHARPRLAGGRDDVASSSASHQICINTNGGPGTSPVLLLRTACCAHRGPGLGRGSQTRSSQAPRPFVQILWAAAVLTSRAHVAGTAPASAAPALQSDALDWRANERTSEGADCRVPIRPNTEPSPSFFIPQRAAATAAVGDGLHQTSAARGRASEPR